MEINTVKGKKSSPRSLLVDCWYSTVSQQFTDSWPTVNQHCYKHWNTNIPTSKTKLFVSKIVDFLFCLVSYLSWDFCPPIRSFRPDANSRHKTFSSTVLSVDIHRWMKPGKDLNLKERIWLRNWNDSNLQHSTTYTCNKQSKPSFVLCSSRIVPISMN